MKDEDAKRAQTASMTSLIGESEGRIVNRMKGQRWFGSAIRGFNPKLKKGHHAALTACATP